jgi:hypothetical protein
LNDEKTEASVIIDGKPADARERCALFDFYARHGVKISRDAHKIRHFSFDYSKKLADENHV